MKITEICVGNYVYNKDNELCKVCVVDLRTNSVTVDNYAHNDGTFYRYFIEDITPIPLTDDTLAENDFVWDGLTHEWDLKVNNDIITINYRHEVGEDTDDYLFIWIGNIIKPIRYVHELQNLFIILDITNQIKL